MEELEIIYEDMPLSEVQEEIVVNEVEQTIEVVESEEYNVEMSEAFPSLDDDLNHNHALLHNRELHDSHPITAITGLREELNLIRALKTVYSDKKGNADYYEWADGIAVDGAGYFVSLHKDVNKISICAGDDIFGVVVDGAAFVGGQSDVARDNHYGMVATTGVVDVRCELDVSTGDYVISNAYGRATKSPSNHGYRVVALNNIRGTQYATIILGITADQISEMGVQLGNLDSRVEANYKNIISAVNVANQAYNKASETESANKTMSDKVDAAVGKVDGMQTELGEISEQVSNSALISAQAKAIAESAATSATSMKNEAVNAANDAASKVGELTKTLEPLTTWKDPETGNSGASYLADYINNGLATKAEIETVEDDLEHATSAILKNAKSIQSLIVSIDKYSVGEYSMSHGLTLDQAASILEEGIIYVPTTSHKEQYTYVEGDATYTYEREFTLGYLYRWGEISDGRYGWITVDKFYSAEKLNTSAPAVYFTTEEVYGSEDFGYWYTNGENVADGYEPYTLYKWEEGQWIAVATLAGNVNNRNISQIRQTANEIALEVTNARGSAASLSERITDTEAEVQSLALWSKGGDKDGEQYNLATIQQKADEAGASISQVVEAVGKDGEVNAASIITAVNNDTSGVTISANRINLKGQVTFESFDASTKQKIEADSIDVQIWSSRGNIFKSRDVSTILTCHVFSAGVDITSTLPNSAFTWTKTNNDGIVDETWTATPYGNNANAIQISSAEVFSRAMFNCEVQIEYE